MESQSLVDYLREVVSKKDDMIKELTEVIEELENELNAYKNKYNLTTDECTLGYIPDDRDTYGDITD